MAGNREEKDAVVRHCTPGASIIGRYTTDNSPVGRARQTRPGLLSFLAVLG